MRKYVAAILLVASAPACGQDAGSLRPKLEKMAQTGNAEAMYHLGMFYQVGTGVPVDHKRALEYFRMAAEKSDPLANYKLGCFYSGQDDVLPPDEAKALFHKLVAAEAGYALAQQDVAAHYTRHGEPALAERWLAQAAAQGVPDAMFGYASLHNGKNGIARDGATVVAYFTLFLATRDATDAQRDWLKQQSATLSPKEVARANEIVANFAPHPTLLTLKALSGQRAAAKLVEAYK